MTKAAVGLVAVAVGAITLIYEARSADAFGGFTLPYQQPGVAVTSWFDHNSPGGGNNNNMIRYDGATWTDGSASLANCTIGVNCYDGHAGIDYGLSSNSIVIAAAQGTVQFIGWQNPNDHGVGFGFYVRLWHSSSGKSTLYGHLLENYVVGTNQYVPRGFTIGYSDNSGFSQGPHLHFGVYNAQTGGNPIDPYGWAGGGSDPWPYNQGYLWMTHPPRPPYFTHYQPVAGVINSGGNGDIALR